MHGHTRNKLVDRRRTNIDVKVIKPNLICQQPGVRKWGVSSNDKLLVLKMQMRKKKQHQNNTVTTKPQIEDNAGLVEKMLLPTGFRTSE